MATQHEVDFMENGIHSVHFGLNLVKTFIDLL